MKTFRRNVLFLFMFTFSMAFVGCSYSFSVDSVVTEKKVERKDEMEDVELDEESGENDSAVARLEVEDGEVLIKRSGDGDYKNVEGKDVELNAGDSIKTMDDGFASVVYVDDSITRLDRNTELLIQEMSFEEDGFGLNTADTKLQLAGGHIWNNVRKLTDQDSSFEVSTSNTIAAVRGTKFDVWFDVDSAVSFYVSEEHDLDIFIREKGKRGEKVVLKDKKALAFNEGNKKESRKFWEYKPTKIQLGWVNKMRDRDVDYDQFVFKRHEKGVDQMMKKLKKQDEKIESALAAKDGSLNKLLKEHHEMLYFVTKRGAPEKIGGFLDEEKNKYSHWRGSDVPENVKEALSETDAVIFKSPEFFEMKKLPLKRDGVVFDQDLRIEKELVVNIETADLEKKALDLLKRFNMVMDSKDSFAIKRFIDANRGKFQFFLDKLEDSNLRSALLKAKRQIKLFLDKKQLEIVKPRDSVELEENVHINEPISLE